MIRHGNGDRVDVRLRQQFAVIGVAPGDTEPLGRFAGSGRVQFGEGHRRRAAAESKTVQVVDANGADPDHGTTKCFGHMTVGGGFASKPPGNGRTINDTESRRSISNRPWAIGSEGEASARRILLFGAGATPVHGGRALADDAGTLFHSQRAMFVQGRRFIVSGKDREGGRHRLKVKA